MTLFMKNKASLKFYTIQFFCLTFFWSITLTRFVLMIPIQTYSDGNYQNVERDFYMQCFISFGVFHIVIFAFFGVYGSDFITINPITRKINYYFCTILFSIANCIFWSVLFEIANIIMFATKLGGKESFNESLYQHNKVISFLTVNYMPWWGRVISLGLILLAGTINNIYCLIEGHKLPYKHITLYSDKVDKEVKFVHLSDIHIGSRFIDHAQKIVQRVIPIEPEFIVITGDLADSPNVYLEELMPFKEMTDRIPTYMSLGNHDYICGLDNVRYMTNEVGIELVENGIIELEDLHTTIVSTNDADVPEEFEATAKKLGKDINESTYNIVLQHRPFGYNEVCAYGKYDLMLSGHTHVGQLWPWYFVTYFVFPKPYGLYPILSTNGNHTMQLYTNPGTGAWGPHFRTKGKNEITFIHLRPEQPTETIDM